MLLIVDGENFRHQIARSLVDRGRIQDMKVYFDFDFAGFCRDILDVDNSQSLQIIYVTTKIEHPDFQIPQQLEEKINIISASNRRWLDQLTSQGVGVVKAGFLRIKESNACVHCGKRTQYLLEKGVDVRVATEVVLASQKQVRNIVLASSDGDMIPALEAARNLGADITYLCYDEELNRSVANSVDKVVTFNDTDVLKYFRN